MIQHSDPISDDEGMIAGMFGWPDDNENRPIPSETQQSNPVTRKRPIRKPVYFNGEEWQQIETNMQLSRANTFAEYAREMLVNGHVIAAPAMRPVDPITTIVSPLANNLNQIARVVNANGTATTPELVSAELNLKRIRELLETAFQSDKDSK